MRSTPPFQILAPKAPSQHLVLDEAALHNEERTVLTALLPHRPGELARLTRLVADAGVNIDAIYVLRSNAEGIEFAISIDQADEAVPELPITGGVLVV